MSGFLSTSHVLRGAAATLAAAVLAAACADTAPTAPTAAPAPAAAPDAAITTTATTAVRTLIGARTLLRTTPLPGTITRSVLVTQAGGKLTIPEAGLTVTIPANALPQSQMVITATALPGRLAAYDFQPHGTRFRAPLRVQQSLAGSNYSSTAGMRLEGGYFANIGQLDFVGGNASLDEVLPATQAGSVASFGVSHFSGYIMATGRR